MLAAAPVPALSQGAGLGAAGELVDPDVLRVCADPSNMPFTDESGEGFENKLAELVAGKLDRKSVTYTWFPSITGFVRNTLRVNRCDIIMGIAQGDELVQNTNAYYRSVYVLVHKKGDGLDGIETIEDPRLKGKRIGVVEATPPASNMAAAKLMGNARTYPLMLDTRVAPSMGEVMVKDLIEGTIDVAILWGPMAGYYVRESGADLAMVPLLKEKTGSRMIYRITMGVRPADQEWKRSLNRVIRENQDEINKILHDFNIPLIDEQDRLIAP
ncbi:substrate-binding domain-containing protein [Aquamicrobium sp. LC103]|uniref:substrate-binding domain-containing protein n=1 Tax=Aquamicrobium sp. LC103 TaxID=1120658 RepID=UPI00063EAEC1|nr:substrate-binding domain-containing protein [Aquamicrobium sp. LC103]